MGFQFVITNYNTLTYKKSIVNNFSYLPLERPNELYALLQFEQDKQTRYRFNKLCALPYQNGFACLLEQLSKITNPGD